MKKIIILLIGINLLGLLISACSENSTQGYQTINDDSLSKDSSIFGMSVPKRGIVKSKYKACSFSSNYFDEVLVIDSIKKNQDISCLLYITDPSYPIGRRVPISDKSIKINKYRGSLKNGDSSGFNIYQIIFSSEEDARLAIDSLFNKYINSRVIPGKDERYILYLFKNKIYKFEFDRGIGPYELMNSVIESLLKTDKFMSGAIICYKGEGSWQVRYCNEKPKRRSDFN